MAKLLDLLVAAEGFVPVAGRVYAQDGDGEVWWGLSSDGPIKFDPFFDWWVGGDSVRELVCCLADDYQMSIITAEAILEARACL